MRYAISLGLFAACAASACTSAESHPGADASANDASGAGTATSAGGAAGASSGGSGQGGKNEGASGGTVGAGGGTVAGTGGVASNGGSSSSGGAGSGGAPADAGSTDAGPARPGCLAFDMPPTTTLRASEHKVFAHYFSPFPVSIDNRAEAADYYTTGYLSPGGEAGKWQFCGGYLRDRPISQAPSASATWQDDNYELEVRRAIAMGLDGFTFDILNTSGSNWDRLGSVLSAAERVDAGFKVVLMPDMYSTFTGDAAAATQTFVTAFSSVTKAHPKSVFALADGRVVVAPYGAEKRDAAWWATTLKALSDAGTANAFMPLFSNVPWQAAATAMQATVPMYGVASWGVRTPSGAPSLMSAPASAHAAHLTWMAPVAPQDMRPKDLIYREAQNSLAFRLQWEAAINGKSDWVQLITWNDYSEHTEVSPSARAGFAFSDLAAYYVAWFKTGAAPAIVRDRLLYFHRVHATTAPPDAAQQSGGLFKLMDATPATDEVEVVAMLTSPGKLTIRIGNQTREADAPAGLSTLRAPLAEGQPEFVLERAGKAVLSVKSDWTISNKIVYQDLYYRGGGSPRCGP